MTIDYRAWLEIEEMERVYASEREWEEWVENHSEELEEPF